MTLHVDQIAARIEVCRQAEMIVAGQDTIFAYYSGQRRAYEKVFGENYDWKFPEDWTLSETVSELLSGCRRQYRAGLLESALTSCDARDYLQVDEAQGAIQRKGA